MRNVEEDIFRALRFLEEDPDGWARYIRDTAAAADFDLAEHGISEADLRRMVKNAHRCKARDLLNELATSAKPPHQTIWQLRDMVHDGQLVLADLKLDKASLSELETAAWRRAVPTLIKQLGNEFLYNKDRILLEDTLNWCQDAMRHSGMSVEDLSPEDRECYEHIEPLVRSKSQAV